MPGRLVDVQIRAGEVAAELLAWDKARFNPNPATPDPHADDPFIERGAGCYQRMLSPLHGELDAAALREAERWLGESRQKRADRQHMTDKGNFFSRGKLRLTDQDYAQLDRRRPELSFTGGGPEEPEIEPAEEEPVAQLNGLKELHRAGALTDEEFAVAKARVIARL